ncbi:MAG: hypothetical protein GY820_05770 [Gammaproteobacteria bacterium]|nr:hypothetical protein [Gammaproteobacteria bacterium]
MSRTFCFGLFFCFFKPAYSVVESQASGPLKHSHAMVLILMYPNQLPEPATSTATRQLPGTHTLTKPHAQPLMQGGCINKITGISKI